MEEEYMKAALEEARRAFSSGEVPVGAVVVFEGKIIARASNAVENSRDASAHAELTALRQAAHHLKRWRLTGCTLYSTLEPCAMCLGAIYLFRIDRLVYGAKDHRHGALGSWVDLTQTPHPMHKILITGGVLEMECGDIIKNFFKLRRVENDSNRDTI